MGEDIVLKKFKLWTAGLGPAAARISIFEHIRDIPYAIVAQLRDPVTGPAKMLELNKGSCVPKHFLLAKMFGMLNIPVKYVSYLFKWDDPSIKYPESLKGLVKKMPLSAHLACKAYINGEWALLDATWDLRLAGTGFPVNAKWDGYGDTRNAVKPIKETVHETLDDRVRYSGELKSSYSEEDDAVYGELSKELNKWLESIREPKTKT